MSIGPRSGSQQVKHIVKDKRLGGVWCGTYSLDYIRWKIIIPLTPLANCKEGICVIYTVTAPYACLEMLARAPIVSSKPNFQKRQQVGKRGGSYHSRVTEESIASSIALSARCTINAVMDLHNEGWQSRLGLGPNILLQWQSALALYLTSTVLVTRRGIKQSVERKNRTRRKCR